MKLITYLLYIYIVLVTIILYDILSIALFSYFLSNTFKIGILSSVPEAQVNNVLLALDTRIKDFLPNYLTINETKFQVEVNNQTITLHINQRLLIMSYVRERIK